MTQLTTALTIPTWILHRLYRIDSRDSLNHTDSPSQPRPDLAAALGRAVGSIRSLFYRDDVLNYEQLRQSAEYRECLTLTQELEGFNPRTLSSIEAQRAFWINTYNLLMVKAVIAFKVQRSSREVGAFFSRAAFRIAGMRFSANDIEHGVLRGNAGHPYLPGPQFRATDPRLGYVLPLDVRVHFALNCAAHSCPPIRSYDADRLDDQLTLAAQSFAAGGGVVIDAASRTASLSRIFLWYSRDFPALPGSRSRRAAALHYIAQFLPDSPQRAAVLDDPHSFHITVQKYDWSLNALPSSMATT